MALSNLPHSPISVRKRKGVVNERRSRTLLESQGYRVTRAGGSFGTWDLVAIRGDGILLVQVKTARWPVSQEMSAMMEFPAPENCRKLIHRWQPHARTPEVREL